LQLERVVVGVGGKLLQDVPHPLLLAQHSLCTPMSTYMMSHVDVDVALSKEPMKREEAGWRGL
jgi:hypothetical protein